MGTQSPSAEHVLPVGHWESTTHIAQTPDVHVPVQHSPPVPQAAPSDLQLHLPVALSQFQLFGQPICEHDLHVPPAWQTPKEHCESRVQPWH